MSSDTEWIVDVTALAAGGDGVGRLPDGRVVFIEGGVPGDRLLLDHVREQKRFVRAGIGRVLEASADRIEPRCRFFGSCGGCSWQHVRYSAQLEAKVQIVRDALERIGALDLSVPLEIVGSPEEYGYRARARWVETSDGIGYRVRGSHEVTSVSDCPVLVPEAVEALRETTQQSMETRPSNPNGRSDSEQTSEGKARKRRRKVREWIVTAGLPELREPGENVQVERARQAGPRSRTDMKTRPRVEIEVLGERLGVRSESFLQGNALLWESLASYVRDQVLAGESTAEEPARFVELYCGIGFFTVPIARAGLEGLALESDPSGIADLFQNLSAAGVLDRVRVVRGRVEARGDLRDMLINADRVLVDPPRAGLDPDVLSSLCTAGPARVVYVSCDPATLARDLKELCIAGYEIAAIKSFDLFPQTPHVESVVTLSHPTRT